MIDICSISLDDFREIPFLSFVLKEAMVKIEDKDKLLRVHFNRMWIQLEIKSQII